MPLWLAVVLGVVCFVVLAAVVVGAVLLLAWVGFVGNRRVLAILAVGLLGAAATFAAWLVTSRMRSRKRPLAGEIIPFVAVLLMLAASWPFVRPMIDVRSVAIALGWSDAPNVGTLPSQVLHRINEARAQSGGSDALASATDTIAVAAAFVVLIVAMLVIAGALGGVVASRGDQPTTRRARFSLPIVVMVSVALAFLAWPSVWVMTNAVVDFDQSAGPESGVNISEVVNHPESMWGRRVVISAEVRDVLGPHSAIIGNEALLVGDALMIIGKQDLADQVLANVEGGLEEGDVMQVTGTVQRYEPERLASDLGVELDAALSSDYGGQAVLVVDAIDLDVPPGAGAGDPELMHQTTAGHDYGVSLDDVVSAPQEHIGLKVTVSGEIEETVLTPHVWVLDDQGLLAISEEAHPELFVEATAYTTGQVGIFGIAEAEQATGLDLDDAALAPFEGRPYILVESVTLVR